MKDISSKSDYDGVSTPAPADEIHAADEYNDRRVELQGSVDDSGQTLAEADAGQLSKAMFANGVGAQSMVDSGGVSTVVITPITGANGLRLSTPATPDYTLLNGAIFSFKANNTNNGNMTVNIGQTVGTLLGVKSLFLEDGTTQVPANTVISGEYYIIRYDVTAGIFILIHRDIKYVEIDSPSATDTVGGTLIVDGLWHDISISAAVPAHTTAVNVRLRLNNNAVGITFKVRSKESSGANAGLLYDTQVVGITVYGNGIIGIDPSSNPQTIQYLLANVGTWQSSTGITILGYWA